MLTAASIAVDALAYGMVLFVISIGLSITMGLMRVINLAHGAFAMVGGYLASWATLSLGSSYGVAIVIAVFSTMILAIPLEILLYRRVYGVPDPLIQVLMTIGITFAIIGVANWAFGPTLKTIPLPDRDQRSGRHRLPEPSGPSAGGDRGRDDRGARALVPDRADGVRHPAEAAVDNPGMAAALGIRTELIYAATFALSVGLGAFGGVIGAEMLPIEPYYALRYMVTFLVVVSVGGAGSIGGALLAALLLGLVDTTSKYLLPEYGEFFFYAAVIAVVWAFPRGLLGRAH